MKWVGKKSLLGDFTKEFPMFLIIGINGTRDVAFACVKLLRILSVCGYLCNNRGCFYSYVR